MLGRVLCPLVGVACAADNQVTIAAAGGVEVIVQGMQAHVGVAAVQEEGAGALTNLAFNGPLLLQHLWWRCWCGVHGWLLQVDVVVCWCCSICQSFDAL